MIVAMHVDIDTFLFRYSELRNDRLGILVRHIRRCPTLTNPVKIAADLFMIRWSSVFVQTSESKIKSGHWPVVFKFLIQSVIFEFGLLVLVAEKDAILLFFADCVGKQTLNECGTVRITETKVGASQETPALRKVCVPSAPMEQI